MEAPPSPRVQRENKPEFVHLADTVVFNRDGRDPNRETKSTILGLFIFIFLSIIFDRWRTMRLPALEHGLPRCVAHSFQLV
jgi:hypothetical protein